MISKEEFQDPFDRITPGTAKGLIDKGGMVVVDVRESAEWSQGHIAESVHIPLGTLMNRPRELLQQDGIIFVCAEGIRSAVACEVAAAIGRTQIYNLEGGTIAWLKQGYPLTR
ncbi:sulfurtransferase [Candidatus Methylomirabilis limnetica]|uniref:Sulfurtransferase n=1 Tax=Candidatus Methylomirabilis limnetica TaxID=2033718 RepID=A0A2T4TWM6_9BACT|nr:rhodanese-like domain-containing protein [Candidatus Methylomirabilis limnetica]PTL35522.1 sulfurtransferase [Candidatus Methylomirabilis limnetica]